MTEGGGHEWTQTRGRRFEPALVAAVDRLLVLVRRVVHEANRYRARQLRGAERHGGAETRLRGEGEVLPGMVGVVGDVRVHADVPKRDRRGQEHGAEAQGGGFSK